MSYIISDGQREGEDKETENLEKTERVSIVTVKKVMECCPQADGKLAGLWEGLMLAAPELLHSVTYSPAMLSGSGLDVEKTAYSGGINGSKLILQEFIKHLVGAG